MKVIESLISKMSIPVISSSVALIKLTQMQPNTAITHYLKAFIGKSYNFPRKVINILNDYFLKFSEIQEELPVVWHQLLLSYCQQYGGSLDEMIKSSFSDLISLHNHKIISP